MTKSIFLVLATALITAAACYLVFKSTPSPRIVRLIYESPDRKFAAIVVTHDSGSGIFRNFVQTVTLFKKEKASLSFDLKPGVELGMRGNSVAAIQSCENDDIEVQWMGNESILIRYFQRKPDWITSIKVADGISVVLEEMPRKSRELSQLMPAPSN